MLPLGQEDNTMNFDGDIKITPFNLKEEQEEGSFRKIFGFSTKPVLK